MTYCLQGLESALRQSVLLVLRQTRASFPVVNNVALLYSYVYYVIVYHIRSNDVRLLLAMSRLQLAMLG